MMKKPVIQSVDFAEEWIVPRYAIDMYQLLAISLIRLRMFVITARIKSFATKDKYIYSAKFADVAVTRRRSESRQGVRLSDEKKEELDELVTRLVKKGQPLTHIYAEHENEMPVCLRTLYNYIDEGALSIKNIDLRRKTGYKPRKKKYNDINGFHSMEYR